MLWASDKLGGRGASRPYPKNQEVKSVGVQPYSEYNCLKFLNQCQLELAGVFGVRYTYDYSCFKQFY